MQRQIKFSKYFKVYMILKVGCTENSLALTPCDRSVKCGSACNLNLKILKGNVQHSL